MNFGIYTELQATRGSDHGQRYKDTLRQIEVADELGFQTFMTLEHHFFPTFSISTNPLAMYAAAAQRTRDIRFRTMCHTLPIHNPMVLAAEIAEADHLVDGRLEVGVGRGHGWLYDPSSLPMTESIGRYEEGVEILIEAWTQERMSYSGEFYNVKDVEVVPKPLQKPHPKMFITGTSGRAFRKAAERGWGICVGAAQPSLFTEAVGIYREACEEFGTEPYVSLVMPTFLAEDEATAHREGRGPTMQSYANLVVPQESINSEEHKKRLLEGGFPFYASGFLNQMREYTFEYVLDNGVAFIGSPEGFLQWLDNFRKECYDFHELALMCDFGDIPVEHTLRTMKLFKEQVAPQLV